jgi:putative aminopeptidase FrvX
MEQLISILKDLTQIVAPSGYEKGVAEYIKERASPYVTKITIDRLGNIICQVNSKQKGPKIAISAHMDEIGFFVRKIEENGLLRVVRLGGIEEKSLPGKEVIVINKKGEKIQGVFGIKAHHLATPKERETVARIEEIYVDIGAESRKEVYKWGIEVGCPMVFNRTFFQQGNRIFANSIDNRGGCAVLLRVLAEIRNQDLPCEVYLIGSVQEEFSLRGILPAVRTLGPDLLICLDIAPACDTPDLAGYSDVKLGCGPAINLYSFHGRGTLAGLIPAKTVVDLITQIAEDQNISLQRNVFFGGLTDASFAQLELKGMLAVDLGFPTRYAHSPVEVCDYRDLEHLTLLLVFLLNNLDSETFHKL